MSDLVKDKFHSPYDQMRQHNGEDFEILGEVEKNDTWDWREVGDMYHVLLECGERITAWPEEILNV